MIEFGDARDILLISAALQIYHDAGIAFAKDAVTDHPEIFSDEVVEKLEQRIVGLINTVNAEARAILPEVNLPIELPEDLRPYAVWGAHAVHDAKQFGDLMNAMLEQVYRQIDAQNN